VNLFLENTYYRCGCESLYDPDAAQVDCPRCIATQPFIEFGKRPFHFTGTSSGYEWNDWEVRQMAIDKAAEPFGTRRQRDKFEERIARKHG